MTKRLKKDTIRKIKELAVAGASLATIADELKINKSTVYFHARNHCRKMTKFNLDSLNEFEKGYVVGFFLGDGSFNKGRKTPRYIVRFALDAKRDQEIATRLVWIFGKADKKVSIFPRENTLIAKVCSKELVEYIQTHVEYRFSNTQKEKNLFVSKNQSLGFQFGVLAGIIDSDGHVHSHLGTEIKTMSPAIFQGLQTLLDNLGIIATTKRRKATENSFSKKDSYTIYIPSFQMKKHQNEIHSVKVKRYL